MEPTSNLPVKACPVCGSSNLVKWMDLKDHFLTGEAFSLIKCHPCGIISTQPQPPKEVIGSYYKSSEYISHSNSSRGVIHKVYKAVRSYAVRKKIRLVEAYQKSGSILDIGCGTGHLLHGFKSRGWNVVGIEPDASAAKFAVDQWDLKVYNEDMIGKFESQTFDVVSMWHVLEHVHDVNERMKQVFRILKDDGVAVVALPNPESLDAKIYQSQWAAYDVPRHLFHFPPQPFIQFAQSHGFYCVKTCPMVFDAYYVSLLSEKYLHGRSRFLKALLNGFKSNLAARSSNKGHFSSLIYILRKTV